MTRPATDSVPGAAAAAAAVREGRRTAESLVRECLEVIEARDDEVRAWVHLDADGALAEARARDGEPPRGPLHGVPVGVKDIIDTADLPTERGTPVFAGRRPHADAACVARLRAAGAVVLGKTATTEVALFHPAATTNPHDPSRTPGGSSSGSAAAVAAGMVPLTLGTQTAGSIVRPAAFCGVTGFKPTYGHVPIDGVLPVALGLDTVGPIAPSVEDCRLATAVLTGDPVAVGVPEAPPRIGVARTPWWETLDPAVRGGVDEVLGGLVDGGLARWAEPPPELGDLAEVQQALMGAEAARELAELSRDHAAALSERLRTFLEAGGTVTADEYQQARRRGREGREQLARALTDVDALVVPAVLGEAPTRETTGDPLLCRPWTLLGAPAVAVAGLRGPEGLPLGLQVVAAPGRDGDALAAAEVVETWLSERA